MEDTLPAALADLFQGTVPSAPTTPTAPTGTVDERARAALEHYNRAIEHLKAGDWAGFGNELDALRPLLEQLGR
jgi:hypothetical protein